MRSENGNQTTMNKNEKTILAATIVFVLIGTLYFIVGYIFGIASAKNYELILAASLKMGAFSSACFSICLALSGWKHRWLFLAPIIFQVFNAYQAIDRLKHLVHH
jgi:hypothetical protein